MRRGLLFGVVSLFVSACGGGGGGSSTPTNPSPQPQANRAPTITNMQVAPSFGIAGITQFNFASSATDQDGDSLSYTWEFADGNTRTGASVIHNYLSNAYGTGNVRLIVSDGKGGSVSDTRPVTVGNVGGNGAALFATPFKCVRRSFRTRVATSPALGQPAAVVWCQ